MKKLAILTMLALELAIGGCGNNTPTSVITTTNPSSTWEAQFTGGTGPASELTFTTQFSSSNFSQLDITGFSFINAGPCFANGVNTSSETGAVTLTTTSTGAVTGSMTYAVTSLVPSGNLLTLTSIGLSGTSNGTTLTIGSLSNGIVWGTWTLTGGQGDSGCTGGGNFVMCQGNNTCKIP